MTFRIYILSWRLWILKETHLSQITFHGRGELDFFTSSYLITTDRPPVTAGRYMHVSQVACEMCNVCIAKILLFHTKQSEFLQSCNQQLKMFQSSQASPYCKVTVGLFYFSQKQNTSGVMEEVGLKCRCGASHDQFKCVCMCVCVFKVWPCYMNPFRSYTPFCDWPLPLPHPLFC